MTTLSNSSAFVDASETITNFTSAHLKCYEYKIELIFGFDNTSIPLQELVPCNDSWTYENQGYHTIVEEVEYILLLQFNWGLYK